MKKMFLWLFLGSILFLVVSQAIKFGIKEYRAYAKERDVSLAVKKEIEELNQRTPIQLDDFSKIIEVKLNKKTIEYYTEIADLEGIEFSKKNLESLQIMRDVTAKLTVCDNKIIMRTMTDGFALKYLYVTKSGTELFYNVIDIGACFNFENNKDKFIDLFVKKHNALLPLKWHEEVDFFKTKKNESVIEQIYKFKNIEKQDMDESNIEELRKAMILEDTVCLNQESRLFIEAGYSYKTVFTDKLDKELFNYLSNKRSCNSK